MKKKYRLLFALTSSALASLILYSQTAGNPPDYPAHLPYRFVNFAWWSDADLRAKLKHRFPSLDEKIAPDSRMEGQIRSALTDILRQRGIQAEVQTEEPSSSSLFGERTSGAPAPAILFSIVSPQILVEKLVFEELPPEMAASFTDIAKSMAGKPYTEAPWYTVHTIKETLQQGGYLQADVTLSHDAPLRVGDHYSVVVHAIINIGPIFRISSLLADGGPLLPGRDLSQYFGGKVGDIARPDIFGRLTGALRTLYWSAGYADVEIQTDPALDTKRGLAAYRLRVIPGPIYHLRSLKIENLTADQEKQVRAALGLKPGDIYDETKVSMFNITLSKSGPNLSQYGFSWRSSKDTNEHVVDLSLNFFKK